MPAEEAAMKRTAYLISLALVFWNGCATQPGDLVPEVDVVASVAFAEGPTVDAHGNVYFTDIPNSRIMKVSTDGKLSTFRHPSNNANGLLFDEQGRLIACEGSNDEVGKPRVTRTDMNTGAIEVIAEIFEGKRLNKPNDVTMDSKGRLYFSDRPQPRPAPDQTGVYAVYRIDPDGSIARILVEPEIEKPNGLVISPDDKTFYLIEAHGDEGRARMIRAYDLLQDGSVANMRVFHNFYPGRSGDGMTIDSEGNLYVAAGLHRRRGTSETLDTKCGVHVFRPDGTLKQFIPIPEDTITNCAFGGPDMKTLYITAGKTLYRVRTEITGTPR
jgi:gluconolactonase